MSRDVVCLLRSFSFGKLWSDSVDICTALHHSAFQLPSSECTFFEVDIGMLDSFVHGLKRKSYRKKSMARKNSQMLKVVSTGNNDALLFPLDTSDELIRRIGIIFGKLKAESVKENLPCEDRKLSLS